MTDNDRDQELVAAALASAPPPDVTPGFVARVNARIDADAAAPGWLGLADFRAWTLRLLPVAAAAALLAILWPDRAIETTSQTSAAVEQPFTPASAADWQQEVNANALLEAALTGSSRGR